MLKNDTLRRAEHEALRNQVGYYKFTHQLLEVKGTDSAKFLDKVFVNSISKTAVGGAKYTTMLDENGGIIDDVIVFKMADGEFRISTLYINELIAWFDGHKAGESVEYKDITPENDMYAVQGPNSRTILNKFLATPVDGMKFFTIADNKIGDVDVKIARSGYTGELGYEIYCAPDKCDFVEKTLEENGKDLGIMKITSDVIISSIPVEKGYVLMDDIRGLSPFECGFGWAVAMDKDFVGKCATETIKATPRKQLIGFEVADDAVVASGMKVCANGKEVGTVTKFSYGYTVEKAIGYAVCDMSVKAGDCVTIGEGVEAKLVDRIWYDVENKKPRA